MRRVGESWWEVAVWDMPFEPVEHITDVLGCGFMVYICNFDYRVIG